MFRKSKETANHVWHDDIGKLLLRITIGGLMLFHGVAKTMHGIGSIEGMLAAKGLPSILAYGVYIGEIVAPVLILIGFYTRISALVFAFNMLVAIVLAHGNDIFAVGEFGGWVIELQMLYLLGALVIAFIGPGRFCAGQAEGWRA